MEDCILIFKWANDEDVRGNSFNTNIIKYREHIEWFKENIQSQNTYIFILEYEKQQIGQIRLNIQDSKGVIGYSIDKKFRGKGYGTKILAILEQKIKEDRFEIKILEGNVKVDNINSQKCFEKNNYQKYIQSNYIKYKKNISCF